jgi:hypothetical protein
VEVVPFGVAFPRKEQMVLRQRITVALTKRGWRQDKNLNYLDLPLDEAGKLLWPK